MFTYLLINLGSASIPFAASFERRIGYHKNFGPLFKALSIVAAVFLFWDYWFTRWGVWSFNPEYLIGLDLFGMPVEEWMFFFAIPFACLFIYEAVGRYLPWQRANRAATWLAIALIPALLALAAMNTDKLYTSVTSFATALFLLAVLMTKPTYLGRFFIAYGISLLPFLVVNGLLTSVPVVLYDNSQNLGLRLGTIPVEDSIYMLLLLLGNVSLFEFFKRRRQQHLR